MELRYVRNFVRGTIDGMLTSFGTVIGAAVSGSAYIVIIAAIASGVASAFGNLSSAFTSETAEVYSDISRLGKKMAIQSSEIKSLRLFKDRIRNTYFIAGLEGCATVFGALLPIIPFFFAFFPPKILISTALIYSIIICLSLMFVFGGMIGKLFKESIVKMAIKTGLFGIVTFIVTFVVTKLLGLL